MNATMSILVKQKNNWKKERISILMLLRKKSNLSLIFKHLKELNHSFNFDNPKILIQNSNVRPHKFLESFFTSGNSNSLNRCINFSEIYSPIITEIISKYSNWSAIRSILVYLSFFGKCIFFSHSSNKSLFFQYFNVILKLCSLFFLSFYFSSCIA